MDTGTLSMFMKTALTGFSGSLKITIQYKGERGYILRGVRVVGGKLSKDRIKIHSTYV